MTQALETSMQMLSDAGVVARRLRAEAPDGYVERVLGIGTAVAEAVAEKGSESPVSDPARHVLAQVERRLRHGPETGSPEPGAG